MEYVYVLAVHVREDGRLVKMLVTSAQLLDGSLTFSLAVGFLDKTYSCGHMCSVAIYSP